MNSNADIIERIGIALLNNDKGRAKDIIEDEYKFTYIKRWYNVAKKAFEK